MSIKDHLNSTLEIARKFQSDLLNSFPRRKETLLQTVEALASMIKPSSVVELSQSGPFQRTYSNIQRAIDGLSHKKEQDCALLFLNQTRMWTDIFLDDEGTFWMFMFLFLNVFPDALYLFADPNATSSVGILSWFDDPHHLLFLSSRL